MTKWVCCSPFHGSFQVLKLCRLQGFWVHVLFLKCSVPTSKPILQGKLSWMSWELTVFSQRETSAQHYFLGPQSSYGVVCPAGAHYCLLHFLSVCAVDFRLVVRRKGIQSRWLMSFFHIHQPEIHSSTCSVHSPSSGGGLYREGVPIYSHICTNALTWIQSRIGSTSMQIWI